MPYVSRKGASRRQLTSRNSMASAAFFSFSRARDGSGLPRAGSTESRSQARTSYCREKAAAHPLTRLVFICVVAPCIKWESCAAAVVMMRLLVVVMLVVVVGVVVAAMVIEAAQAPTGRGLVLLMAVPRVFAHQASARARPCTIKDMT